eukprot:snap_masked-scaffold_6-processed-gene-3.16-mRNA-1 protein AED:0.03 eAED:0.04 QI:0/-1/0/1/-1/1/1/0/350
MSVSNNMASTNDMNWLLFNSISSISSSDLEDALKSGAEPSFQDEESGSSLLIEATKGENIEAVKILLNHGAPWNALDRKGMCAGEYAMQKNNQELIDLILNSAVKAELLLGTLENKIYEKNVNKYLENQIEFKNDGKTILETETEEAVMMEWEKPLMKLHSNLVCSRAEKDKPKITVLNVGFGMGIVDSFIQENAEFIEQHIIIEPHPQVLQQARKFQSLNTNVRIIEDTWQKAIPKLLREGVKFDGIFFDTYGEYYRDMKEFQNNLPKLLKLKGIYTFFNGLAPRNIFFHAVACEVVNLELTSLGFEVYFHPVEIKNVVDGFDEETWEGVKNRYWFSETYFLPVCLFKQ